MTNTYHDQLDAFEARVRAEQEETEIAEKIKFEKMMIELEGSDSSMMTQLNDSGYGSQGVF